MLFVSIMSCSCHSMSSLTFPCMTRASVAPFFSRRGFANHTRPGTVRRASSSPSVVACVGATPESKVAVNAIGVVCTWYKNLRLGFCFFWGGGYVYYSCTCVFPSETRLVWNTTVVPKDFWWVQLGRRTLVQRLRQPSGGRATVPW